MPFVLLILPFIYVLSSVTVCMELLPPLRRNPGNLLLFILSYAYLSIVFAGANKTEINPYFDVTGLQFIVKNVFSQFRQYFALSRPNDPSISLFNLFVNAQYAGILSLIVGITFAVASASLTVVVPPNLFNVLYILMWYMGIIQKIEVLMMVFSYKKI